ncbi:hypothetical protein BJH93_05620 [Kocuria polaris]|nr:hypothetical protein [Kocuria polaris]
MIGPALWLWLKRSSAKILAPGIVLLVAVAVWSRPGWEYEWGWALSWTAGISPVVAPLVAGIAAHDRAVRHSPTLVDFERSTVRGYLAALSLPVAVFIWALAAWLIALCAVAIRVSFTSGLTVTDYRPVAEIVACLLAAACLGAAVGGAVRNRAAGPAAALLVYFIFLFGPRIGLDSMFAAGGKLDPLAGSQRNDIWTGGFVGLHMAVAVACALVIIGQSSVFRRSRLVASLAAVLVLSVGIGGAAAAGNQPKYDAIPVATVCVGQVPQVCGPHGTEQMLEVAAKGLSGTYDRLGETGLDLPDAYVWDHDSANDFDFDDKGSIEIDPGRFEDGRLTGWDSFSAIYVPRPCDAYRGHDRPDGLLTAQRTVATWLESRLDGSIQEEQAPPAVRSAYSELVDCPVGGAAAS